MVLLLAILLAADAADEAPPDLEGRWGLELAVVSAAKVPVLGKVRSTTRVTIRLDVRPGDEGWEVDHLACGVDIDGGSIVTTTVPPAYVAAMPRKRWSPTVARDEAGWTFAVDLEPVHLGYDPQIGGLPETRDDPQVMDGDGDGEPGVTVTVSALLFRDVQVYLANTNHPVLEGRFLDADHVAGAMIVHDMGQQVLGASNRLFAASPTISNVPGESRFEMVRLPDDTDCLTVRTRLDEALGRSE